ncbi:O-antigen ligase family protein [Erythrobacter sp. F6033]|uniref:O-antigen ligase family protein n=1 Tax=Erythrobacter sp. F6033 TaxID=2926401 RepID=UPI001FF36E4D|nr:O-antigen ligase family protein [Erythrobacter sp. F6033]MCK0129814.1 O-antigen ligase family protein [Erythrobacter sp. F6033]
MSHQATSRHGTNRPSAEAVHVIVWLALFAGLVTFLGGSSRFDAVQAAALRPLAALFLIPALYWYSKQKLDAARAPMVLLGLTALWTAIQLIPLPPSIWHLLPGRAAIVELDALHGLEATWRPISFVPMRGWNALMGMIVPVSAGLLAVALRPRLRTLFLVIVGIGVVDALLGLLQIIGDPQGPLYFYTFTNGGAPVGIFANENHSGVFSAITLLVIARIGLSARKPDRASVLNIALAIAFLLVTLAVLVSGSRAAFGLGAAAYAATALMAWLWLKRPELVGQTSGPAAMIVRYPRASIIVGLAVAAGLLFGLMQFERAPGVVDALNQNAFEDLRWRIGYILGSMISTHWLFGTGFGSWDAVYQIYEPTTFMGPAYVNQAHNDWAQLIIEGGVPAVLLLLALGRWIASRIRRLFAKRPSALARCVFWLSILAIAAAASLVDYPLRTPIFQLVAIWLVIALAFDARDNKVSSLPN